MKRRVLLSDEELFGLLSDGGGRFLGPMRPGKTLRDKRSGAWARRLRNRQERAEANKGRRR